MLSVLKKLQGLSVKIKALYWEISITTYMNKFVEYMITIKFRKWVLRDSI